METEQIHELTLAEIARLTGAFNAQRQEHVSELAELFSAAGAGAPEPQPVTEHAEAVRSRALHLMNGHSPDGIRLPPATPRRQKIEIEIEALDLVLDALSKKELVARAAEAAAFAIDHGDEWAALCRDILLTATRLGALEARAQAWRQNLGGASPSTLPLAPFIGTGRSVVGVPWGADPLSRARTAALEAKIITAKELKGAADA